MRRHRHIAPFFRLRWLMLGLMGVVLAGCQSGPRLPAVMPDGRIPVRVYLLLISTAQVEYYQWAEETFEAANPDIDVIIEQFPGSSLKDFEIKLRLRFSSRQAPDLFHVNEHVAAELADLGLLAPAPPSIVEMIEANSLNAMVQRGGLFDSTYYGIVSDAVWTVLYYNKDHFREVGLDPEHPPQTWDALIDYADQLTIRRPDSTPMRTGLSLRKSGFKAGTAEKWLTFLFAAGGQAFTDDGAYAAFNSEAGRAALELYKTVLFDRNIDSIALEGDQQGFGQQTVSMFIREAHVIRWLQQNYPDLDFGVAHIPKRDTSISAGGNYLFSVSADSPNPDAAWRFAEFVRGDAGYTRYAAVGGIVPATQSVAAQPRYANDPYLQVFLEQNVQSPGGFPRIGRALDILGAYIERFCYGRIGIDEMLERAEQDVNAVLAPNRTNPES